MKVEIIYYFKPAKHWNVVSEQAFNTLSKFYSNDGVLKIKAIETEE